ncbi:hypothetical protein vseg_009468 [Gypsophila vaccaria]
METSEGGGQEHIILIPFMAQGHLRPFLHLARRLSSRRGYTITLLTTPLNAAKLRDNLNNDNANDNDNDNDNNIVICGVAFNGDAYDLPPGVENTDKLPLTHVINLFHSSSSLEPHLETFLTSHITRHGRPPLAVIFDNFLGWADRVARKFNSIGIAFSTCGAYGTAAYSSIWCNLPHRKSDQEDEFCVPGFPEDRRFRRDQLHRFVRIADGNDNWSKFFRPQIEMSMKCSGWLVNSVEEVEPLGFKILRNYLKLPVWAVGPLVSTATPLHNNECINWLNKQAKDSVLYVSFGSQNTINPAQMMELAAGLESSGKRFLWVIRPPFGFDINGEFKSEWLPDGFEARVIPRQGMIIHKWGPQLEILGHEAVGGFMSHCGWNSVLEGLREGVPMIGWPLAAEQAYNAKMLVEEMGVAVEVARGVDGEVGREKVRRVIDMVLDRAEGSVGSEMKRKAVALGRQLRDAVVEREGEGKGSSGMNDFLEFVLSKQSCNENSQAV